MEADFNKTVVTNFNNTNLDIKFDNLISSHMEQNPNDNISTIITYVKMAVREQKNEIMIALSEVKKLFPNKEWKELKITNTSQLVLVDKEDEEYNTKVTIFYD